LSKLCDASSEIASTVSRVAFFIDISIPLAVTALRFVVLRDAIPSIRRPQGNCDRIVSSFVVELHTGALDLSGEKM
jgi:hypothetical protein